MVVFTRSLSFRRREKVKKVLITGIYGFVGFYLSRYLLDQDIEIVGFDAPGIFSEEFHFRFKNEIEKGQLTVLKCDLNDVSSLNLLFHNHSFDSICHLAGTAFVPDSWRDPAGVLKNNTLNTVHFLQVARDNDWIGRFLYISSSDVYGSPPKSALPITETTPVSPESPYASSKYAAEEFALYFNNEKIKVIVARPFNHIGPGQKSSFVVPSFLKRILSAEREGKKSIAVGDLSSGRDFTDVRDVVKSYKILMENGIPGEIYNVCSGKMVTIQEILDVAIDISGAKISFMQDSSLLRPGGVNFRYGSAEKLEKLGWKRNFTLKESMIDIYKSMLQEIENEKRC